MDEDGWMDGWMIMDGWMDEDGWMDVNGQETFFATKRPYSRRVKVPVWVPYLGHLTRTFQTSSNCNNIMSDSDGSPE